MKERKLRNAQSRRRGTLKTISHNNLDNHLPAIIASVGGKIISATRKRKAND